MENNQDRPSFGRWIAFHVIPAFALLVVGVVLIAVIVKAMQKEPEQVEMQRVLPVIDTITVMPEAVTVEIASQGTVEARTRTNLVAEISGHVESISPALYAGGFFKKGDILATIDNTDYIANLATRKGRQAEAQLAYQQELEASAQALEDWKAIGNDNSPSDLVLRKPQIAIAEANLEAAQAAVKSASRDLNRTEVKAPYDGRVQEKFIDVGQIANARTTQIASVYSIDKAEIRLTISLNDTRFVDIPEAYRDESTNGEKPKVTIETSYGGETYQWEGIIDRSEGSVDPQTRLLYIVAQINDPYAKDPSQVTRPPLKVGSFVTATIHGNKIANAYKIPRRALRENNTVYIVTQDRHLEIRPVEVYQKTTEFAIVTGGLAPEELICLTPLQYVVNGMQVVIDGEQPEPATETPEA